jgi:hypothetical protein
VSGRPFIGSEGERDGRTDKRIGRPVVGRHYWPSGSVGRGNRGGEWGVKRGLCGAIFERGRDARAVSALEAASAAAFGRFHPEEEGSRAGLMWQRGRRGEGRVGRRWGEGKWATAGSKSGDGSNLKKILLLNFN